MTRSAFRLPAVTLAALATILSACGGENLVLPSEGTAASIGIVSGNNQSGTVGDALADSLVVRVTDSKGRAVPDQPVSWSVVAGGGSVAPTSTTTDANGRTATSWTLGSGAGTQQVLAKPTGNGAPGSLQAAFAATAGASSASALVKVSGDAQTAVAGSALADSLVVKATDALGNPVAGVTVQWAAVGGGAVSMATVVTGADGRSAVKRTLGPTAGAQTTTATVSGLTGSPITFTSTATVGSAGQLVIVQQPSATAASGAPLARQPKVQIEDGNGNPVSLSGVAVEAAIASGPAGASLSGISTVATSGTGLATFLNLGISGPAGTYSLNFSVPNRSDISGTPPSSPITLSAGSAARLTFGVQPTSITAGGTISPAVTVRVEDALGNLVTGATNAVTMSLAANPGGATLSGTKTVSAVNGVATFSTLSLDRPGTGYTLGAAASGLTADVSNAFDVTTGSASSIAANSATSLSGTAGSPVTPVPSVKVTDGSGNGVAGVNVTFAVTLGGGSVSGATQTTDASGIATVGSWTLGTTAGTSNNKLTASASGLSGSPVTFTASAAAGSAGKLLITTQPPSNGTSGSPLLPAAVIQLADANGNPVAQGGVTITATIASGPGGSLTGASVNTNSQGQAQFSSLVISGPSGTYQLGFNGTNLTGVISGNIVIGAGAATKLGIVTQPSASVPNGQIFPQQPVVELQDAAGNPVGTSGVSITVALQSCSGLSLGGTTSASTNISGQASFTNLKLTGTVGTCKLLFASSGLTGIASNDIQVTAGAPSAANSTVAVTPTNTTAGIEVAVDVTFEDQSGNAIDGGSVTLSSDKAGTFGQSPIMTDASGKASTTFTPTEAASHTITASLNGVNVTTTLSVSAASVSAAQSTLDVNPTSIPADGTTASTVTVTALDAYGNPINGANVDLSVSGSGNSGAGTTSANGSGVAVFFITSTVAETKTVTATVDGTTINATGTLTALAASASNSSVSVTPPTTSVGTGVTVTVLFEDVNGDPFQGASVSLVSDLGGTFTLSTLTTDASGQASTTFTPTEAGGHTITATLGALDVATPLTVDPAGP